MTFVGYLKSPQWAGVTWIKVAPVVHLFLLVLAMLVIPLMVAIQTFSMWSDIHQSVFSGPLLLYPFISICVILQFPIYFLGRIKEAVRLVNEKRQKIQRWHTLKLAREQAGKSPSINPSEEALLTETAEEEEQLRKLLFTNWYKPPYLDATREPGCGPVRIGSKLALQEDMYTLLFVSYFKWALVEKAQEDQQEKETA